MSQKTELELLKERADVLGIKYANTIGVETLRERVNEVLNNSDTDLGVSSVLSNEDRKKKALKLVRVQITCMDPSKGGLYGGIYSVTNRVVGTVCKYIPYNTDERGYHIPQILLNSLKRKRYQQVDVVTDPKTRQEKRIVRHNKLFNFVVLPDLTQAELDKLYRDNLAVESVI